MTSIITDRRQRSEGGMRLAFRPTALIAQGDHPSPELIPLPLSHLNNFIQPRRFTAGERGRLSGSAPKFGLQLQDVLVATAIA